MVITCKKEIFLKELEDNKDFIDKGDWEGFFNALEEDVAELPYKDVRQIEADYIRLFKENGVDMRDVFRKISSIYSHMLNDEDLKNLDLTNVEVIFPYSIYNCTGSIHVSKKLQSILGNAIVCPHYDGEPIFTIYYDGTKDEWNKIEQFSHSFSDAVDIVCSDGTIPFRHIF